MVEVSLTVGKLDASLALLLTKDHHLIEFPTILLPNGVKAGSIVKIRCDRDSETEEKERQQFRQIQDEILATYGKNLPQNPVLKTVNVTQTSCVLAWDPLDLGTATLKSLVLYKDGKKLGAIPNPLSNHTTKLSGLPIDKTINFQLKLDSTAGIYSSDTIEVTTHKMTDLSGINVCLGDIATNEQFSIDDIQETLRHMGAFHPASNKVQVETTHFIATRENKQNEEYLKANEMNIPVIRPEWLKACERERRIVGVRDFYVKDCVLPDIISKNYWKDSKHSTEANAKTEIKTEEATETEEPKQSAEIAPIEGAAPIEEAIVSEEAAPIKEAVLSEETAPNEETAQTIKAACTEELPTNVPDASEEVADTKKEADEIDSSEVTDKVDKEAPIETPITTTDEKELGLPTESAEGPDEPRIMGVASEESKEEIELVTEHEAKKAEADVSSTQAMVEPYNFGNSAAEELPAQVASTEEFENKDVSLENVAKEDPTDAKPIVDEDTGVSVVEGSPVATNGDDKEQSPGSLEDVEL